MKSIQKVFALILIVIVFSCSKDDGIRSSDNLDGSQDASEIVTRSNQSIPYNTPIYSPNELIVQYALGINNATKATLRAYHGVIAYELCPLCLDERIEKWFFDMSIQIEPKKHVIETFGGGVVEVDYEFEMITEYEGVDVGSWEDTSYEPLIVSDNSGITIAILDTGFDPFFPFWYDGDTPIPMLYNASETGVVGELCGWDFVNNDPNPFDDNPGKHGSIISYEFQNVLNNAGVPFQILPAKIFDENGKTNYFNLICSANYVFPNADVVQMSFGWYDDTYGEFESTILKNLIEEYSNVIVVASAGNGDGGDDDMGDNNDGHAHYPSSYDASNIIAVAATNEEGTNAAPWSNYGLGSVDFWAAGMQVPFYDYDYEPISGGVQGTSFAAAQIAALAAMHQYFGGGTWTPTEVIDAINFYGTPAPWEGPEKVVKYHKYYPMMVE